MIILKAYAQNAEARRSLGLRFVLIVTRKKNKNCANPNANTKQKEIEQKKKLEQEKLKQEEKTKSREEKRSTHEEKIRSRYNIVQLFKYVERFIVRGGMEEPMVIEALEDEAYALACALGFVKERDVLTKEKII